MKIEQITKQLFSTVIEARNCTHCGACAGIAPDLFQFKDTPQGPLPYLTRRTRAQDEKQLELIWKICPGRQVDYPSLWKKSDAENFDYLAGPYSQFFIGYSKSEQIRRNAASGGVLSSVLCYLLQEGLIDGAITLRQGIPKPELASPILARTQEDILASAQSVYSVTPLLKILKELEEFEGKVALVALPDQVAAVRALQEQGYPPALKIAYILGPYVGTNMVPGAIRSFLRANNVRNSEAIGSLKWRAGEWPGHLEIKTETGKTFKALKFYYNYLIPFFISDSSLRAVDFSNELTDISVGDAWSPQFEKQGAGFSVVISRSKKGGEILKKMAEKNQIALDPITKEYALSMHGHMIDFKKRGTFIRLWFNKFLGKPVPSFGYHPIHIPLSRYGVEFVISGLFFLGRMRISRWISEKIPLSILGPLFNSMRLFWKNISKPVKRKSLRTTEFILEPHHPRN
jgi:coenzyme F420 hydrogenase subunit beta